MDTDAVIGQKGIEPTPKDNYCTYPLLQLIVGKELLSEFLPSSFDAMGKHRKNIPAISAQYYHPTIWECIVAHLRGVK